MRGREPDTTFEVAQQDGPLADVLQLHPEATSSVTDGQVEAVGAGIAGLSLFERYKNEEITVDGLTGTPAALRRRCPKDLSKVPPEDIHKWMVRTLTEAGYELTEEEKEFVPPPAETPVAQKPQKKNWMRKRKN